MLDWERRAYAVDSGRCSTYAGPQIDLDEEPGFSQPTLVPMPQYPFVDAFDELPEQDQQRIKRDGQAAADAFVRAYAAFAGIRHPITETETDTVGIERMDPIAGATRVSRHVCRHRRSAVAKQREWWLRLASGDRSSLRYLGR